MFFSGCIRTRSFIRIFPGSFTLDIHGIYSRLRPIICNFYAHLEYYYILIRQDYIH